LSKIKDYIGFLISSLREIIKGFLLFIFATSGLFAAVISRSLDFNGVIISIIGIIVEVVGMVLCYFAFRSFLDEKEKQIKKESKSKK
jgi:protein-S-isoprenylcysteine O-methyltransferase Ste14